ncbi:MAG TPA: DNA repair protein RecO C-terminal domain-containing protein, partial [Coriobacteriia bacterium]|nr:DNA repair protein RecO C-terminal domain-containing protein [Coriobacteriia bacterium]
VFDVLDKIAVEGQPEPRLFGLACATLSVLESAPPDRLIQTVTAFLVKGMAMHGYRPHVDSCLSCASTTGEWSGFSLESGGLLCRACGGSVTPLTPGARDALAWMLRATMTEVVDRELPSRQAAEAFGLIRQFVSYHLPARLKALELFAGGGVR